VNAEWGSTELPLVEVTYYTDPLCPWSWALEPQWRRLRFELGDQLTWHYVLGGMVADWQSYHDPVNEVHNPGQMAQQCYYVRQLTGMPLDERIWHDDPPSSSYPACLAVKAAERQGRGAGEAYLRRVREAVMLGRRNIARGEVLVELAEELASNPSPDFVFNVERFRDDILGPEARDALHGDLRQISYQKIGRFPTLVLRAQDKPGLALAGYRPYDVIRRALNSLVPGVRPRHGEVGLIAYLSWCKRATSHEVAVALEIDHHTALRLLDEASVAGVSSRVESLPETYQFTPHDEIHSVS
jgi:putative protein-disulfide isomerase